MFCPNCGNQIKGNASFCSNCGYKKIEFKSNTKKIEMTNVMRYVKIIGLLTLVIVASIVIRIFMPRGIKYSANTTIDEMDTISFGTYPQNDTTGFSKEPIEWIVLERKGKKMLLLSKYILDCKCYNFEKSDCNWETCSLRSWLNSTFYNAAFNDEEKSRIQTTILVNKGSKNIFETLSDNDTSDNVFILDIDELYKYFYKYDMVNENKRLATRGTNYAKKVNNNGNNLHVADFSNDWDNGNSDWWTRLRYGTEFVPVVSSGGGVGCAKSMDECTTGVRPALWVSY